MCHKRLCLFGRMSLQKASLSTFRLTMTIECVKNPCGWVDTVVGPIFSAAGGHLL